VSRTTAELDPRNDNGPGERTTPQPEAKRLPAARISFVRFALVEIEQFPEDGPLAN
jgi:hypothetical protein